MRGDFVGVGSMMGPVQVRQKEKKKRKGLSRWREVTERKGKTRKKKFFLFSTEKGEEREVEGERDRRR
jgi:hypothetical protein